MYSVSRLGKSQVGGGRFQTVGGRSRRQACGEVFTAPCLDLSAPNLLKFNLLESITDAFVAFDREWRLTYVNKTAAQLVHKSQRELLGQVGWELFPKAKESRFYTELHQVMVASIPMHFEAFHPPPLISGASAMHTPPPRDSQPFSGILPSVNRWQRRWPKTSNI